MEKLKPIRIGETEIPVLRCGVLVIGSGVAALAAADRLVAFSKLGISSEATDAENPDLLDCPTDCIAADTLIVTEVLDGGASFAAGLDRKPYYRLSLEDKEGDSAWKMAEALWEGGTVHGDLALVEALGSLEAFHYLISIGVGFPMDEMGASVGIGSDLDPKRRGISIGPYTSKLIWERLHARVRTQGIPILEGRHAIALIADKSRLTAKPTVVNQKPGYSRGRVYGALFIDGHASEQPNFGLELVMADAVVLGTGGPGGLYGTSTYPKNQAGAIGLAIEIGAACANLTETQFGLASQLLRCSVSGSYQRAIPRYFSRGPDGDEEEFLTPFFKSPGARDSSVFRKGFQTGFDAQDALKGGASLVDLLVHRERVLRGRQVFIDFIHNPGGWNPAALEKEAMDGLEKLDALDGTPLDRLKNLDSLAVDRLTRLGIDPEKDTMEITVGALHGNGGLASDKWWESVNMERLFPLGEVNGSHGIYPPDGADLNASQVGALRAARKIIGSYAHSTLQDTGWQTLAQEAGENALRIILTALGSLDTPVHGSSSLQDYESEFRARMDSAGGMIRPAEAAREAARMALQQVRGFHFVKIGDRTQIPALFRARQLALAQAAYLEANAGFVEAKGGCRGSALIVDVDGKKVHPDLEDAWKVMEEKTSLRDFIQIVRFADGVFRSDWEQRRPIP